MSIEANRFHTVPTTARSAEVIALRHGYDSLGALATSLPPGASVIDVGAGASPFGKELAALRPDAQVVTFDLSYNDPAILAEAKDGAPDNLEVVQGDATELSGMFPPEKFDAVFSIWLMPHLSLYSHEPARRTAKGMYEIAKYGGSLSVGPLSGHFKTMLRRPYTHRTIKEGGVTSDEYAKLIVDKTHYRGLRVILQRVNNEGGMAVFGTTRHLGETKHGIPEILPHSSGTYRSILYPKVWPTLLRMEIAAVKLLMNPALYQKVRDK